MAEASSPEYEPVEFSKEQKDLINAALSHRRYEMRLKQYKLQRVPKRAQGRGPRKNRKKKPKKPPHAKSVVEAKNHATDPKQTVFEMPAPADSGFDRYQVELIDSSEENDDGGQAEAKEVLATSQETL